jgi:hypothetical protein
LSGVVAAALLSGLGDIISACSALLRGRDMARAAAALRHARTVFKVLAATGVASHATR